MCVSVYECSKGARGHQSATHRSRAAVRAHTFFVARFFFLLQIYFWQLRLANIWTQRTCTGGRVRACDPAGTRKSVNLSGPAGPPLRQHYFPGGPGKWVGQGPAPPAWLDRGSTRCRDLARTRSVCTLWHFSLLPPVAGSLDFCLILQFVFH